MTRVVIVADSGPVLADLTAAVAAMPGAYIARHGSSAAPAAVVVALRPEPYPDRVANALAARASAVLPSGLEPHELGGALLEIVSGGVVLGAAA